MIWGLVEPELKQARHLHQSLLLDLTQWSLCHTELRCALGYVKGGSARSRRVIRVNWTNRNINHQKHHQSKNHITAKQTSHWTSKVEMTCKNAEWTEWLNWIPSQLLDTLVVVPACCIVQLYHCTNASAMWSSHEASGHIPSFPDCRLETPVELKHLEWNWTVSTFVVKSVLFRSHTPGERSRQHPRVGRVGTQKKFQAKAHEDMKSYQQQLSCKFQSGSL